MRTAFEITCDTTCSESVLHSLRLRGLQVGSWKATWKGRRIVNEALREFIRSTDFSTEKIPSVLFTCSECEVPLTKEDVEELQLTCLSPSDKRFKAVVVDGTAQGILNSLPAYQPEIVELLPSSSLNRKKKLLVRKGSNDLFKKLLRATYAFLRNQQRKNGASRQSTPVSFFITCAPPKGVHCEMPLRKKEVKELRLYLQEDQCICNTSTRVHRPGCMEQTNDFTEDRRILQLLRSFFTVEYAPVSESDGAQGRQNDIEQEDLQSSSDEDQWDGHENGNEHDEQQPEGEAQGGEEASINPHNEEQRSEGHVSEGSDEEGQAAADEPLSANSSSTKHGWKVTFTVPMKDRMGQLAEAVVDTLDLMLCENSAVPFAKPVRDAAKLLNAYERPDREGDAGRSIESISARSIHRDFICALRNWGHCDHNGRSPDSATCASCDANLKKCTLLIREVNPIYSRLARELMSVSKSNAVLAHNVTQKIGAGMELHFNNASKYLDMFEMRATENCRMYQRKYCRYDLEPIGSGTEFEDKTGIVFIGRAMYRPCITFKNTELADCTKKYPVSKIHSPGIFTIQCVCAHPKIIGFRVMSHAESIFMAITSVITHFKYPPRTVFYDNACHFTSSQMLRVLAL